MISLANILHQIFTSTVRILLWIWIPKLSSQFVYYTSQQKQRNLRYRRRNFHEIWLSVIYVHNATFQERHRDGSSLCQTNADEVEPQKLFPGSTTQYRSDIHNKQVFKNENCHIKNV